MGYTDERFQTEDRALLIEALGADVVKQLEADGWYKVEYPEDGRPWADGGFPTSTGKVEFVSEALRSLGQPALPTFIAPNESPLGDPELARRFPLSLLTPKQHRRFMNASYAHLPHHGPREGAPYVELHPLDAQTRGLNEGDLAVVFNDRASLTLPVQVSDRLRLGVVAIPFGWWREHHLDGQVANSLTNDTLTDWGGGVAYSDTLVQIRPA
jgi:anaerobic selenocysteine-containing dehydrogenase